MDTFKTISYSAWVLLLSLIAVPAIAATTEMVSEFDVEGVHFQVLWKPGTCLLRTVEDYGKPDSRTYTVADLNQHLNEGEPDNSHELDALLKGVPHSKNLHHRNGLGKEEAIAKAPLIAKELIREQRQQETLQLEALYTSPEMQKSYPVYQIWQQKIGGKTYPVIWASHNAGLYMKVNGKWRVAGFATSREEATTKINKSGVPHAR